MSPIASFLGPFVPLIIANPSWDEQLDVALKKGALPARVLNVTWEGSGESLWCWAAIAACVARCYAPNRVVNQCDIASACLEQKCCDPTSNCNQRWRLEHALEKVGHSDGAPPTFDRLEMTAIVRQIDEGNPIGCFIQWIEGGGHFVAIFGYDQNTQDVYVLDPATSFLTLPLETFKYRYEDKGVWMAYYPVRS